jgi:hypothetical protein
VKRFSAPKKSLGEIDTDAAAELLAATADITLVLDHEGVIRDVAAGSPELAAEIDGRWVGQPCDSIFGRKPAQDRITVAGCG